MGERAEFMDGFECATSFDAVLPTDEKDDRGADEHDRADARFEGLNEVGIILEIELADMDQHEGEEHQHGEAENEGGSAERQMRLLNPTAACGCIFADAQELADDLAQAGAGEAAFDSAGERLDGLDDLLGIEAPEVNRDVGHERLSRLTKEQFVW